MSQNYSRPRNAERKSVRMPASCRSASGLRGEGWLEDMSAVGCCFVTQATCFKVGSQVIMRPGGLEGITGTIRWVQANRCGIEFTAPLYGAVFDHLCAKFSGTVNPIAYEPPPQYQPSGQGHPLRRRFV